jgi:hypothetical protein
MSGSGCGIESDKFDESILGRRRGIFCSPANTRGDRCSTAAVLALGHPRHRRSRSGHPLARTNVPPTQLRGVGLAELGQVPHPARKSSTQVRGCLFAAIPACPTMPVEETEAASFWAS